jgi:mannosyltransferase
VPQRASATTTPNEHRRDLSAKRRLVDATAVIGPSVLAAGLSFYDIGARSIWLDESASISIASQHGAALGAAMTHDGGNMLVYYALLHVLIGAFGNGILVLRAPSAIAAACTVALVSLLAKRLFDRSVAVASGVVSAVSLPLVFWGQDVRAYSVLIALVAASFLAFVALVDREPETHPSKWAFCAYLVATTLAMYMSFVAVLVVPAQLLSLVCHRKRLRPVVSALVIAAVCCIPLAVLARERGSGQLFWVPKPSFSTANAALGELMSSALQPQFAVTSSSYVLFGLSLVLLAGVAVTAGRALSRTDGEHEAFSQVILICWLVVPFLLALVESAVSQSIFVPRNLLISLPPVGILLARVALGSGGSSRDHARRQGLGWLLVAAIVALRALQLAPSYGVSPENWEAAVSYVTLRAEPRDCIAFFPSDGRMAFEYYIGSRPGELASEPRPVLPREPWGEVTPYVEDYATLSPSSMAKVVAACPRLFLVTSHDGSLNGPAGSMAHYLQYEKLRSRLEKAFTRHQMVGFGYADPVEVELLSR